MFIMKGIALGAVMFFIFSLIYLRGWGMLSFSMNRQVGIAGFMAVTFGNYLYWIVGVLMLALGCLIILMWPVPVKPS